MPIILRHRYFAFNNGTIEPVLGFMAGIGMSWLHHWQGIALAVFCLIVFGCDYRKHIRETQIYADHVVRISLGKTMTSPLAEYAGIATASLTARSRFGNSYRTVLVPKNPTEGAIILQERFVFRNPSKQPPESMAVLRRQIAAHTLLHDFGDVGRITIEGWQWCCKQPKN